MLLLEEQFKAARVPKRLGWCRQEIECLQLVAMRSNRMPVGIKPRFVFRCDRRTEHARGHGPHVAFDAMAHKDHIGRNEDNMRWFSQLMVMDQAANEPHIQQVAVNN